MHNDITARPLPQHLLEIASSTIPSWLPPGATLEQCIYDSAAVAPPPPVMQQHAAPPPSPAPAALHFHTACDSRGPTLIIIQDTRGNAFGAYVSRDWVSPARAGYQPAPGSFLFSLVRAPTAAAAAAAAAAARAPAKYDLDKPGGDDAMYYATHVTSHKSHVTRHTSHCQHVTHRACTALPRVVQSSASVVQPPPPSPPPYAFNLCLNPPPPPLPRT
jgi:hypothetical protein